MFILYPDGTAQEPIPSPLWTSPYAPNFWDFSWFVGSKSAAPTSGQRDQISMTSKHLLVGILFTEQSLKEHQILPIVTKVVWSVQYYLYFLSLPPRDATI